MKIEPKWFCYLEHKNIGCGWRVVGVRKSGWKWIYLCALGCKTNFKMTLKKWATINKRPMYKNSWDEWKADFKDKGPHLGAEPGEVTRKRKSHGKRSGKAKATAKSDSKKFKKPCVAPKKSREQKETAREPI